MEYRIVVDASCDIEDEYIVNSMITVLPMSYSVNDSFRVYDCLHQEKDLEEFYENQKNGDLTKTSQITPFLYEQYFTEILGECDELLYICLSGGLSSTYQSALNAARSICTDNPDKRIKVLDSLSASGGIGILARKAVYNRDKGLSLDDNYDDLLSLRSRIRHFFMVDDLMYLRRGGRISSAAAVVGTAIGIKPILIINDEGKLETVDKKKGNIAAVNHIFNEMMQEIDVDGDDDIYIIDSNNPKMSELLSGKISEALPDRRICRKTLTPIIGAHTGPGLAAVIFVSGE